MHIGTFENKSGELDFTEVCGRSPKNPYIILVQCYITINEIKGLESVMVVNDSRQKYPDTDKIGTCNYRHVKLKRDSKVGHGLLF